MKKYYEQLDSILSTYFKIYDSIEGDKDGKLKKQNFKQICQNLEIVENINNLKGRLIDDGYLTQNNNVGSGEPMKITSKGIYFIENGGYVNELNMNEELKKNEIRDRRIARFNIPLIISILSILISLYTVYDNYNERNPKVNLINEKLVSNMFVDNDGKQKFFGVYKAILTNNSGKSVTLIGLKPHRQTGLLITTQHGSSDVMKPKLPFKIFVIDNNISIDSLLRNANQMSSFKDAGLEKMALLNKVIPPGEIYILNIGLVVDLFCKPSEKYSSMFFTSELYFSNNQILNFGAEVDF